MKTAFSIFAIALLGIGTVSCAEDDSRPSWKGAYPLSIVDSQGLLSAWDVQTLEYNLYTNDENLGITVTTEGAATIRIGERAATNVSSFSNMNLLTEGMNTVLVVVERDGYYSITYTLRAELLLPEKDARLASMSVDLPGLSPSFALSVTNYSVSIFTNAIQITADTVITNPGLWINGAAAAKGSPYTVSGLLPGVTNIPVDVVSQDLSRTNRYLIAVSRIERVDIAAVRATGVTNHAATKYVEGIAILSGKSARNAYIQAAGMNIGINLRGSGNFTFATGDLVGVKFTGVGTYNNLLQINVDPADVTVLGSGRAADLQSETITSTPLAAAQGRYVRVTNVALADTWGDGQNQASWDVYWRNESGTSVAAGTYTFYGHIGQYRDTVQAVLYDQSIQVERE